MYNRFRTMKIESVMLKDVLAKKVNVKGRPCCPEKANMRMNQQQNNNQQNRFPEGKSIRLAFL